MWAKFRVYASNFRVVEPQKTVWKSEIEVMGFLDEISKILKFFFFTYRLKSTWETGMTKQNPKKLILEPEKWKIPFLELSILEGSWNDDSYWYVYQNKAYLIRISTHS